jgi:hypothetical protein
LCIWWRSNTLSDQINFDDPIARNTDLELMLMSRDGSIRVLYFQTSYRQSSDYAHFQHLVGGWTRSSYVTTPLTVAMEHSIEHSAVASAIGVRLNWSKDTYGPKHFSTLYIKVPFNLLAASFGICPWIWLVKWERNRQCRPGFPLIVATSIAFP